MTETPQNELDELVESQMRSGSPDALAKAFSCYRERLKRIVQFRLDYRLAGRISDSDVIQEAYIAAATRLESFKTNEEMPAFLWLRLMVSQQLIDMHRQHVGAAKRDVRREVSLHAGPSPHTSMAIAAHLVGQLTAASKLIEKEESIEKLEKTLNEMDEVDREVIALRHFEELSNIETAKVLEIEPAAASKRYVRAMARLGELMENFCA